MTLHRELWLTTKMLAGIRLMFIESKYLKWALGRRNGSFMQWDQCCIRYWENFSIFSEHIEVVCFAFYIEKKWYWEHWIPNAALMGISSVSVRRGAEVLFYTSHVRIYSIVVDRVGVVNNASNIPFDQSASLSAGAACCRAMAPLHADRWLTQSSWSSWRMGGEKDLCSPSRRKDSKERFREIRLKIDLMVESVSSVKIARNHYIISFHDMKRHN